MVSLIAQYLLVGVAIGFIIEVFIRLTDQEVSHAERFQMIVAWPIMAVVFIYNFFKGLFGS